LTIAIGHDTANRTFRRILPGLGFISSAWALAASAATKRDSAVAAAVSAPTCLSCNGNYRNNQQQRRRAHFLEH
jgi:hypothetical protein